MKAYGSALSLPLCRVGEKLTARRRHYGGGIRPSYLVRQWKVCSCLLQPTSQRLTTGFGKFAGSSGAQTVIATTETHLGRMEISLSSIPHCRTSAPSCKCTCKATIVAAPTTAEATLVAAASGTRAKKQRHHRRSRATIPLGASAFPLLVLSNVDPATAVAASAAATAANRSLRSTAQLPLLP